MEVRNHIREESGIESELREITSYFIVEYGTSQPCNSLVLIFTIDSIESSTVVLSKHVTPR